jgi:hypothetical protein
MPLYRALFVLLILFFFLPIVLLAQKKGWQDVVYLKNGSIIRGHLRDSDNAPETIRIETIGRNLFVFKKEEVARVARKFAHPEFVYPYTQGYINITEAGLSVGNRSVIDQFSETSRSVDFTLQTFNGYQFHSALALGLTTALDTYGKMTLLPVGLGLRGDITKNKVRPYYGFDAGYALDWLNNPRLPGNYNGGRFWSPTFGLKFNSRKTHSFILNIGYRHQKASIVTRNGNTTTTQSNQYQRVLFRLGMSF